VSAAQPTCSHKLVYVSVLSKSSANSKAHSEKAGLFATLDLNVREEPVKVCDVEKGASPSQADISTVCPFLSV